MWVQKSACGLVSIIAAAMKYWRLETTEAGSQIRFEIKITTIYSPTRERMEKNDFII